MRQISLTIALFLLASVCVRPCTRELRIAICFVCPAVYSLSLTPHQPPDAWYLNILTTEPDPSSIRSPNHQNAFIHSFETFLSFFADKIAPVRIVPV